MKTKELEFTPKQVSLSKVFNKVPEKLLEGYCCGTFCVAEGG